jgi:di-N-acetylchitobiase
VAVNWSAPALLMTRIAAGMEIDVMPSTAAPDGTVLRVPAGNRTINNDAGACAPVQQVRSVAGGGGVLSVMSLVGVAVLSCGRPATIVVQNTTQLKSDDSIATNATRARTPSPFGQHRDAEWWTCVQTCKDPRTGKPTPELCSPLNPQPNNAWETVAPQVGGERDHFIYGANGTEWRQWMRPQISGGKVTAMPTFNGWNPGYSSGSNAGFLCEAHRQRIRVMDSDTLLGLYSPFSLANHDIFNESAMVIWAEATAHFMVSAGIDGFSIDLENAFYTFMDTDAAARAAFVSALARLKSRMQAVLPGSLLAVWIAAGGAPWSNKFTKAQMATTVDTVDQFWIMNYAMCGHPYADVGAGMSNDPLPFIDSILNTTLALGIPAEKLVSGFPWYNCNFDCGAAGNPHGGVNCSKLRPKEFCPGPNSAKPPYKFCFDNVTDVGYAQTLPLLKLGQSQGSPVQWDEEQVTNYVNYFNESDEHYHQVWFDDPISLALKYAWAAKRGLRGIALWTPSATLFDEDASRKMWAVVPKKNVDRNMRQKSDDTPAIRTLTGSTKFKTDLAGQYDNSNDGWQSSCWQNLASVGYPSNPLLHSARTRIMTRR